MIINHIKCKYIKKYGKKLIFKVKFCLNGKKLIFKSVKLEKSTVKNSYLNGKKLIFNPCFSGKKLIFNPWETL
jgi:hypothetical protein